MFVSATHLRLKLLEFTSIKKGRPACAGRPVILLSATLYFTFTARKDDVDEVAIDQRLDIYFSKTVASIEVVGKRAAGKREVKVSVDGEGDIGAIRDEIQARHTKASSTTVYWQGYLSL